MPTIQHISLADYQQQRHAPAQVAIRIADTNALFGVNHPDQMAHRFIFADANEGESGVILAEQADKIVAILQEAKANNHDVVVHCVAGISRSGAVAQFAIDYLGFEDYYAISGQKCTRIPNLAVSKALRLAYQGETDYDAIFSLGLPS